MKCLTFEKIMAYLDDEVTVQERSQIDKHLEECSSCLAEFEAYAGDCGSLDRLAEVPPLPDMFTRETMARIAAEKLKQEPKRWTGKLIDIIWRGTILKKITVVAATVTLAISLGTFVSPTFASYVGSLLASGKGTDTGLKNVAEHGLTQPVQAKVTDQGITFTVKEMFADPMRIAAVFGFEKDGKPINSNDMQPLHGRYDFYVTDTAGNLMHRRGFNLSTQGMDTILKINLGEKHKEQVNQELPNNLVLHMEISQIGTTKGKWNLSIPIDLQKMREKTAVIPINSKYTAEPGISIELKQAVKGVSATQLSYEYKLSDELVKKYRDADAYYENLGEETEEWRGFDAEIAYRILDDQGKVVAANDQGPEGGSQNTIDSMTSGSSDEKGMYKWMDAFDPTVAKGQLTFELTKVFWDELADFKFTFESKELKKKAQSKEYKGNTITVKNITYNPVENAGTKEKFDRYKGVVMEVEVEHAKDVVELDNWAAKDETGKLFVPETMWKSKPVKNEEGNYTSSYWITVREWDKIPKTITLEAHRIQLQNTNVNWKVPMQLGEK